ncbi:MAG: Ig-like domain-containing protein [Bacteroidales bacterium]|nr:Ig-like domain-containing protein [Bacteroidales bacterium]
MKRFIFLLSVLSLTVACSELYGPEETPLTPDTAAGVQVSISDVTDNSFKVTVTPSGETSYYSYLVDQADAAETLDPETLYKVGYESVAQGTVEYAKNPSYTFVVSAEPNTTYQVYAVAASPMGFAGEVVVKSVTTSDGVNPVLTGSGYEDTVLKLSFSEAVTLAEGTATLRYFARQKDGINEDVAEGTYTVPADSISCEGEVVTFTFAGEVPAGAYYSLDYTAGMFVDSANNPVAELKSGFSAASGSLAPYGVFGRADFTTWEFDAYEETVITDPTAPFVLTSSSAQICKLGEAAASVAFSKGAKTTTIGLTPGSDYVCGLMSQDPESDVAMFALPEAPEFGSVITITIPEDTFWDIYGNSNAECEVEVLLSFGYTLEDVVGTYDFTAYANQIGDMTGNLVIEASNNAEKGNVMITSLLNIPCMVPIYGTFDLDAGTLDLYGSQPFYQFVDDNDTPDDPSDDAQIMYVFYTYNNEWLQLKMTQAGVLGEPDDYFGVAVAVNGTLSSWAYLFLEFDAQKSSATTTAASASANFVELQPTLPLTVR